MLDGGIVDRLFDFDELVFLLRISRSDISVPMLITIYISCCLSYETLVACLGSVGIVFRCLLYREPCLKRVLLLIIYTHICKLMKLY